jgi:hypothetical protein
MMWLIDMSTFPPVALPRLLVPFFLLLLLLLLFLLLLLVFLPHQPYHHLITYNLFCLMCC